MTPDEWALIQDLIDSALDLPPAQRAAFLESASGGNPAIRQRAEDLIAAHERADSFFSQAVEDTARQILKSDSHAVPGQTVGGYRILSQLGQGGMGIVFKAEDPVLRRPVALKFMNREWVFAGGADRLLHEAQAASALNHPNILTVYGVVRLDTEVAIVMEFVEGKSLRDNCGNPLPVYEVIRIGRQIALALAAAHENGIVHRDMKPENVMLRPDGYVKVLDFGLARDTTLLDRTSQSSLSGGTLRYMAPEQIEGTRAIPATDVFSLGLILYEMTAGTHPFAKPSAVDTAYAIAHSSPQPLPAAAAGRHGVPPAFADLVARMLAKDPPSRPGALHIATVLRQLEIQANAPSRSNQVRPWHLAALAAALLLAAIAFGRLRMRSGPDSVPLEALPFATEPGLQMEPSMSPDGRTVAYVWNGPGQDNVDIYLRPVSGGPPRRFTSNPASDISPAWSRDGKWIAYVRLVDIESGEIWIQPVDANAAGPRRLAALRMPRLDYAADRRSLSWSPDGQWLTVSTNEEPGSAFGIFLISTSTGALRRLTAPPPLGRPFGDKNAAFSPDGRSVAFVRAISDGGSELWILRLTAELAPVGLPERIPTGKPRNLSPQWTPDGREIIFSAGVRGRSDLYRVSPWDGASPKLIAGLGGGGLQPAIALETGRLNGAAMIFTKEVTTSNLRRLLIRRGADGRPASLAPAVEIAPHPSVNEQPNISPDGTKIAFVSNRSGYREVWVSNIDGGNAQPWTSMKCGDVAVPRWSYDGRKITFSAQCSGPTGAYTIGGPGELPQRLTDPDVLEENSTWSADGQWIYFTSYRTGSGRIWRVPSAGGGPAVQITYQESSSAWISPEGRLLYFTSPMNGVASLWTMNPGGGTPNLEIRGISFFAAGRSGMYFTGQKELRYLDFATRRSTSVRFPADAIGDYVFAVSPDENFIIDSKPGFHSISLMKVENFR